MRKNISKDEYVFGLTNYQISLDKFLEKLNKNIINTNHVNTNSQISYQD